MTPDEIQKDREVGTPLTVEILADALSCFWNAALGAAHDRQAGFDAASIMAEGVGAVANRLSEYSKEHLTLTADNAALKERVAECEALLEWFCGRVEKGEVRSKKTYAIFRAALEKRHE